MQHSAIKSRFRKFDCEISPKYVNWWALKTVRWERWQCSGSSMMTFEPTPVSEMVILLRSAFRKQQRKLRRATNMCEECVCPLLNKLFALKLFQNFRSISISESGAFCLYIGGTIHPRAKSCCMIGPGLRLRWPRCLPRVELIQAWLGLQKISTKRLKASSVQLNR